MYSEGFSRTDLISDFFIRPKIMLKKLIPRFRILGQEYIKLNWTP